MTTEHERGTAAWTEALLRKMLDNPAFYTQTSGGGERPKVELVFDDVKSMQRFTEALAEARLYLRELEGA
jgi:hypothetical protein